MNGLPKFFEDPRKELSYSGVFCLINVELKLVSKDLIFDGDAPFTPRGCIAQAWTVREVLRAWRATLT